MWQAICTASVVVFILRALPAFLNLERLRDYPRLNKFLDYTICLVTGEVIYSIAFKNIPKGENFINHNVITVLALLLAGLIMWYSAKLSKSLILSLSFFIAAYSIFC